MREYFHENIVKRDVILPNCPQGQLGNLTSCCLGNHGSVTLVKNSSHLLNARSQTNVAGQGLAISLTYYLDQQNYCNLNLDQQNYCNLNDLTLLANIRQIFCLKDVDKDYCFCSYILKSLKKNTNSKKPAEICTAVCDTVKIKCEFRGGKSVQVATYVIFPFSVFFWVGEGELF